MANKQSLILEGKVEQTVTLEEPEINENEMSFSLDKNSDHPYKVFVKSGNGESYEVTPVKKSGRGPASNSKEVFKIKSQKDKRVVISIQAL